MSPKETPLGKRLKALETELGAPVADAIRNATEAARSMPFPPPSLGGVVQSEPMDLDKLALIIFAAAEMTKVSNMPTRGNPELVKIAETARRMHRALFPDVQ